MNTNDFPIPDTFRPFGPWLKATDRLLSAELDAALESADVSRRDARLLSAVDGTAPARRPLNVRTLRRLIARGWVAPDGDGWMLTDEGRTTKDRLDALVDGIRTRVSGAVSAEDMATTLAALERIARALGWDEKTPPPRGRRRHRSHAHGPRHRGHGPRHAQRFDDGHESGRGFGPGHGRGFGHGVHGIDPHPRHDVDGGHNECLHGHPHGRHRGTRMARHAFAHGFEAGFARGRDA